MIENSDGFVYPRIDVDVCTNCNTCDSVCPILNPSRRESDPTVYAVNSKDNNVRRNSSSGGVFSLISEYVLNHNGVVFGAAFNKSDFSVNHIFVEDINDLSVVPNGFTDEPFYGHFCLVKNMAGVLKGIDEPFIKPEETLNVTAILEAAYKSNEIGAEVKIDV